MKFRHRGAMKKLIYFCLSLSLVCICAANHPVSAQTQEPSKTRQFIYVLRLVPRLYSDSNWTKEDKAVLERHFIRFQEAIKSGQLILAGRTRSQVTRRLALRSSRLLMRRRLERSWKTILVLRAG